MTLLRGLPVIVDDAPPTRAFDDVLGLARTRGLTAYDAAYLDLALRRRLPLATGDGPMRRAARDVGVSLLPLTA